MNRLSLFTAVCFLGAAIAVLAEDLKTGPLTGTKLTAFECYANSGPFAGQESFDAAGVIGNGPGAFLFIHVLNRNTVPVLRGVEILTKELSLFGFKSFIVTLSGDRTAGEEQLQRVNGSLKFQNPMVLSLDGLDGPGDLALNRRCTLSLIVVNKGKVTQSIGFTDTGLHDLKRIRESFESAIGEIPTQSDELLAMAKTLLPEDATALRELAARQAVDLYRANKQASLDFESSRRYPARQANMRGREARMAGRPNATQRGDRPKEESAQRAAPKKGDSQPTQVRRGNPPTDSQLNSLLRSFIRQGNGNDRVDEVFASIENRAKESDELDKEAIAMFQLMLSFPDRYGSEHAQKLAKRFLSARGEK